MERRSQLTAQPYSSEEKTHIRKAIRDKYRVVSGSAEGLFGYQTGKSGAIALGYDGVILDTFTDEALESFCGVGNPFTISSIPSGGKILDIGCGAGLDLIVASRLVGENGQVCGIDLTEEMAKKAQRLAGDSGANNISVNHVTTEEIPFPADSFDRVISNGVINLSPSKLELFTEILRVLKPGGVLQFADVSLLGEAAPAKASSANDWAQ